MSAAELQAVRALKPRPCFALAPDVQALAQVYHRHHFSCAACIAAGHGARYGSRCEVGQPLWASYEQLSV